MADLVAAGERILVRVLEYDVERVIHMNANAGRTEAKGSPLGYSVGRWDGDTLVVSTTHVDWPQFDPFGTPQSDQTSYFETFALSDGGSVLNYSFTATDPLMFTQPITLERPRRWTPGIELEPFNCVAKWAISAGEATRLDGGER